MSRYQHQQPLDVELIDLALVRKHTYANVVVRSLPCTSYVGLNTR